MIECDPELRPDVLYVALPLLIVPVPRVVEPSLKVTVPVAPEVTVAVNITDEPAVEGFKDDAKLTEEAALLTVCVSAEEVLAA